MAADPPSSPPADDLAPVLAWLAERRDHDFAFYKPGTLGRRVLRRMSLLRIRWPDQYLHLIRSDEEELRRLARNLLIGVTSFLRDPDTWAALDELVLNPLLAERATDEPLRFRVPGCATGEEAYTLAMLLDQRMQRTERRAEIEIFATDLDGEAIAGARTGLSSREVVRVIGDGMLQRYCVPDGDALRVIAPLRECIVFASRIC